MWEIMEKVKSKGNEILFPEEDPEIFVEEKNITFEKFKGFFPTLKKGRK